MELKSKARSEKSWGVNYDTKQNVPHIWHAYFMV